MGHPGEERYGVHAGSAGLEDGDFRGLFMVNPVPTWVWDLETLKLLEVNDAAASRYGYSRAQLATMTICDLRPPEDVPELLRTIAEDGERALTVGAGRHRIADGTVIDVEITARFLVFRGRRARLVSATDITERRRAEGALREKEERWRAVTQSAPDAVVCADGHGRITSVNPAAERIFGWSADEAVGQSLTILMPARFHRAHEAGLERLRQGQDATIIGSTVELVGRRRDGQELPVELSLSRWQVGVDTSYSAILRDVTDRHAAEAAVRAREEHFHRAFTEAPNGAALIAVESGRVGKLLHVNRDLCTLLGSSEPGLLGRRFERLVQPRDRRPTRRALRDLAEGTSPGTYRGELRLIGPDGAEVWVDLAASLLRSADGAPDRILVQVHDITAHVAEESRLRQQGEEHARRAVAEERARIMRDLHDVVIQALTLILREACQATRHLERRAPVQVLAALDQIDASCHEAMAEMRRILTLADAEEGATAPPHRPGLSRLAALVGQFSRAGLTIEMAIEGEARTLPPGLDLAGYRVVQEALTNVLKHAEGACAALRLSYGPASLELEIVDTGGRSAHDDEVGGYGLVGMRERVALYGGEVSAGARPEGGFAVIVRLPLGS